MRHWSIGCVAGLVLALTIAVSSASAQSPISIADIIISLTKAAKSVEESNDAIASAELKFDTKADEERLAIYRMKLSDLLWSIGKLRMPNGAVRDSMRAWLTDPSERNWLRARLVFSDTLTIVQNLNVALKAFDDPKLNQISTGLNLREEILTNLLAMPLPTTDAEKEQLLELLVAYDRLAKELIRQNDLLAKMLKTSKYG